MALGREFGSGLASPQEVGCPRRLDSRAWGFQGGSLTWLIVSVGRSRGLQFLTA